MAEPSATFVKTANPSYQAVPPVSNGRAVLGIRLKTDTTLGELARANATNGLVVSSVSAGSPAEAAGILVGDILEKVNGSAVSRNVSFGRKRPGDEAVLLINRGGRRFEVRVRLLDASDVEP